MSLSRGAIRERDDAVRRRSRVRLSSPAARNEEERVRKDNDEAAKKWNDMRSRDERRRRRIDQL